MAKNVMEQFSLKGRVAIVTGGGQGLGKSMAIALAQAGCGHRHRRPAYPERA